jgi:hypothetical protein
MQYASPQKQKEKPRFVAAADILERAIHTKNFHTREREVVHAYAFDFEVNAFNRAIENCRFIRAYEILRFKVILCGDCLFIGIGYAKSNGIFIGIKFIARALIQNGNNCIQNVHHI